MKRSGRSFSEIIKLADRAIKVAVRKTLLDHKKMGVPIYVWQHNKVVRIPPHRIPTR